MTQPCLILAAGFGTRMGALTADRPKPLIKVGGSSLLDHALDHARGAQATPIAVNAHYRADQIMRHLDGQADVTVLHEHPKILDSGGAVKNAAKGFPATPMLTINADNVWRGPNPLGLLTAAFDPQTMGALLLVVPRARAVGRLEGGDFAMDGEGRLTLDKSPDTWVYTGAQILDPAPCLDDPRDIFTLRETWAALEAEGRLYGMIYPGHWADVGQPEGIALAEAMLEGADV